MVFGKTILVTGAASGIGREIARAAMADGARVLAVDLQEPDLQVTEFFKADLAVRDSIDQLLRKLPASIDGVANVAGLPPTKPAEAVLKVNFIGLKYFTNGVTRLLNDGASIVNLAALAGFDWGRNIEVVKAAFKLDFDEVEQFCLDNAIEGAGSYVFSKEALIAWTLANRWTWRDRLIRINAVSPGPVDTPILGDFLSMLGERALEDMRLRGAGSPEDIAPVVLFLLSDRSRWITGANIPADGGMLAHLLAERSGLVSCFSAIGAE